MHKKKAKAVKHIATSNHDSRSDQNVTLAERNAVNGIAFNILSVLFTKHQHRFFYWTVRVIYGD